MYIIRNAFVLIIILLSVNSFAQAADTIVISKMVEEQIANARLKQQNSSHTYANNQAEYNANNTNTDNATVEGKKTLKAEEETVNEKVLIIGSAVLAAGAIVGYRRVRSRMGNKNSKNLKANINKLRNEELLFSEDPKLKLVREKLNGYNYYDLNEEKLSQKAKEYKISQGEMMLASRIKSKKN